MRRIGVAGEPAGGTERVLQLLFRAKEQKIDEVGFFAVAGGSTLGNVLEKVFNLTAFVFVEFKRDSGKLRLVGDVQRDGQLETKVGAGRKIDFRLRENAQRAIDDQGQIAIRIVSGQVDEPTGDAALGSVGRADAVDDAFAGDFSSVIDFDDLGTDGEDVAVGGHQPVELDLQRGGVMRETHADFADGDDFAVHFQAGGKDWGRTTFRRLDEHSAYRGSRLGTVRGDRIEKADPE